MPQGCRKVLELATGPGRRTVLAFRKHVGTFGLSTAASDGCAAKSRRAEPHVDSRQSSTRRATWLGVVSSLSQKTETNGECICIIEMPQDENAQKVAGQDRLLLRFAPRAWTPAGKFKEFFAPPFATTGQTAEKAKLAMQTVVDHTHKYQVLASLANRLLPTLAEDIAELHANGYTPASRSAEFAAVFETLICELYAVLDGIRDSLYWLLPGARGLQKNPPNSFSCERRKKHTERASRKSFVSHSPTHTTTGFLSCGACVPHLHTVPLEFAI